MLPNSLHVAGLLHIAHNCVQMNSSSLTYYEDWKRMLSSVVEFFVDRGNREDFTHRCLQTPRDVCKHMFHPYCRIRTKLIEGRWLAEVQAAVAGRFADDAPPLWWSCFSAADHGV